MSYRWALCPHDCGTRRNDLDSVARDGPACLHTPGFLQFSIPTLPRQRGCVLPSASGAGAVNPRKKHSPRWLPSPAIPASHSVVCFACLLRTRQGSEGILRVETAPAAGGPCRLPSLPASQHRDYWMTWTPALRPGLRSSPMAGASSQSSLVLGARE